MEFVVGEQSRGPTVGDKDLHAAVVDENQVRAAAGVTLVAGAIAFSHAYFERQYLLLQIVSTFFLVEFLLRTTVGIRYSPVGLIARAMTRSTPPQWVSAKPKLFAWRLGLALALAMTIITNSGIRGTLPRTLCVICMTLMWMEAALGLCLGCKIHALLVRHGRTTKDPEFEICAHGVCEIPAR